MSSAVNIRKISPMVDKPTYTLKHSVPREDKALALDDSGYPTGRNCPTPQERARDSTGQRCLAFPS